MGTGHHQKQAKQSSFFKSSGVHRFSYGGKLRNQKQGRGQRPISSKEPLHTIFKINRFRLRTKSLRTPQSFKLVLIIIEKYAEHFSVKVEQLSVQNDHIHLLVRTSKRKNFHHFFRVVSGQIAQSFEKEGLLSHNMTGTPLGASATAKTNAKANTNTTANTTANTKAKARVKAVSLWLYRPFTRVVQGLKAYKIVRNYIQLNEKEALGEIKYQKKRLKGLSTSDWQILWA
jgi:REP element-mobilizing transposase RayT